MSDETPRGPSALLATSQFAGIAGSELVLLELAEQLIARGWRCDILAAWADEPMRGLARAAGATVIGKPAEVRPLTYDMVWIQTRLEAAMDYAPGPDEAPRTFFAFAHLDLKWSLTQPGPVLEPLLADAYVVTSEEARDHFAAAGLESAKIRLFRNAAPATFVPGEGRPIDLRRLLIVSNHAPAEVAEAADLLRADGVEVVRMGKGGDLEGRRIEPADLQGADAVLTIGKTVPYALAARVPVFVYDHLGGPGWLSAETFQPAMRTNFSGRCCGRRLGAEALAEEVKAGFADAAVYARSLSEAGLESFRLEPFVDGLVEASRTGPTPRERRARLTPHAAAIAGEQQLTRAANHYLAAWRRAVKKSDAGGV